MGRCSVVRDWEGLAAHCDLLIFTWSHFSGPCLVRKNCWSTSFQPQLWPLTFSPEVASSSAEHDLHSNWVLRVPRVADDSTQKAVRPCANESVSKKKKKKKSQSGSTSSRLQLQRNPIHLPKVVESAFQTLRFKPKLKKQWSLLRHLKRAISSLFGQAPLVQKYPFWTMSTWQIISIILIKKMTHWHESNSCWSWSCHTKKRRHY